MADNIPQVLICGQSGRSLPRCAHASLSSQVIPRLTRYSRSSGKPFEIYPSETSFPNGYTDSSVPQMRPIGLVLPHSRISRLPFPSGTVRRLALWCLALRRMGLIFLMQCLNTTRRDDFQLNKPVCIHISKQAARLTRAVNVSMVIIESFFRFTWDWLGRHVSVVFLSESRRITSIFLR